MSTHGTRSEEHTSELQSHSEISYAVFCLKNKKPEFPFEELIYSWHLNQPGDTFRIYLKVTFYSGEESDWLVFFFFNDTATTEIYTLSYTLSLHDALPI